MVYKCVFLELYFLDLLYSNKNYNSLLCSIYNINIFDHILPITFNFYSYLTGWPLCYEEMTEMIIYFVTILLHEQRETFLQMSFNYLYNHKNYYQERKIVLEIFSDYKTIIYINIYLGTVCMRVCMRERELKRREAGKGEHKILIWLPDT